MEKIWELQQIKNNFNKVNRKYVWTIHNIKILK